MHADIATWIPVAFAAATSFCVVVYVLADGFDLGVGILFLFAPRDADRDAMMASIEPVWDGNETWLVMGGTLLLAAFPAGYYVLLPAAYLPILFMLFALVFRGVAFGFRAAPEPFRRIWDWVFAIGSFLAAFCQGLVLGQLVDGIAMTGLAFAGGPFDFATLLGLLCGVGLVGGYALLGAGWLIWKTTGPTQVFAREIAQAALILTAAMMALVSLWSALTVPEVAARWLAWPNLALLAPVPLLTAAVLWRTWGRLWTGPEAGTFVGAILVFLLGFVGLVVSLWPYVVPRQVTIWTGIADPKSLVVIGAGFACVIPLVLAYQAHAYWIFRGKTAGAAGYGADAGMEGQRG